MKYLSIVQIVYNEELQAIRLRPQQWFLYAGRLCGKDVDIVSVTQFVLIWICSDSSIVGIDACFLHH